MELPRCGNGLRERHRPNPGRAARGVGGARKSRLRLDKSPEKQQRLKGLPGGHIHAECKRHP